MKRLNLDLLKAHLQSINPTKQIYKLIKAELKTQGYSLRKHKAKTIKIDSPDNIELSALEAPSPEKASEVDNSVFELENQINIASERVIEARTEES